MRRLIAVVVGLMVVAALAGCGAKPSAPVATARVEMPKSYRYDPAEIVVAPGTTVTFHNGDNFSHSVKFDQGVAEELILAPGGSGTVRFDRPGSYGYYCSFHAQQMKGKVIVRGE